MAFYFLLNSTTSCLALKPIHLRNNEQPMLFPSMNTILNWVFNLRPKGSDLKNTPPRRSKSQRCTLQESEELSPKDQKYQKDIILLLQVFLGPTYNVFYILNWIFIPSNRSLDRISIQVTLDYVMFSQRILQVIEVENLLGRPIRFDVAHLVTVRVYIGELAGLNDLLAFFYSCRSKIIPNVPRQALE